MVKVRKDLYFLIGLCCLFVCMLPKISQAETVKTFESAGIVYKIIDEGKAVQVGDGEKPIAFPEKKMTIPETVEFDGKVYPVTEIGRYAFTAWEDESGAISEGSSQVEQVEIPSSVTKIQNQAFYSSRYLKTIIFQPESQLKEIASKAFQFSAIKSFKLPKNVETIGSEAFQFTDKLAEFTFEEDAKVSTIGASAFSYAKELRNFYIPQSVTAIGKDAFLGTDNLKEIVVADENPAYSSHEGVLFDKEKQRLIKYPSKKINAHYQTSESIKTIGDSAFEMANYLEELQLNEGMTDIGDFAFKRSENLKKIIFPKTIKHIGRLAFYDNSELKELELPESIESFGRTLFYNLPKLIRLTIAKGIKQLPSLFLYGHFDQLKNIKLLSDEIDLSNHPFEVVKESSEITFEVANEQIKQQLLDWGMNASQLTIASKKISEELSENEEPTEENLTEEITETTHSQEPVEREMTDENEQPEGSKSAAESTESISSEESTEVAAAKETAKLQGSAVVEPTPESSEAEAATPGSETVESVQSSEEETEVKTPDETIEPEKSSVVEPTPESSEAEAATPATETAESVQSEEETEVKTTDKTIEPEKPAVVEPTPESSEAEAATPASEIPKSNSAEKETRVGSTIQKETPAENDDGIKQEVGEQMNQQTTTIPGKFGACIVNDQSAQQNGCSEINGNWNSEEQGIASESLGYKALPYPKDQPLESNGVYPETGTNNPLKFTCLGLLLLILSGTLWLIKRSQSGNNENHS